MASDRIRVYRDGPFDWVMTCAEHEEVLLTVDWALAYEAAVGHACMHHERTRHGS